MGGVELTAA